MPLPKKVYYVSQEGAKLRYGQKGGGLFAKFAYALGRKQQMEQQGAVAKVYEAEVIWKEVL